LRFRYWKLKKIKKKPFFKFFSLEKLRNSSSRSSTYRFVGRLDGMFDVIRAFLSYTIKSLGTAGRIGRKKGGKGGPRVYARSQRANDIYYTSAMNYGPLRSAIVTGRNGTRPGPFGPAASCELRAGHRHCADSGRSADCAPEEKRAGRSSYGFAPREMKYLFHYETRHSPYCNALNRSCTFAARRPSASRVIAICVREYSGRKRDCLCSIIALISIPRCVRHDALLPLHARRCSRLLLFIF